MTELCLIRHGETLENAAGILQGHLPCLLSDVGREQVERLRDSLRGQHFDALLASDLPRAVQTAEILNETLQLPLLATPLLRERDWGEWTGRKISEFQGADFPPSVESVEEMSDRALEVLYFVEKQFSGKRVAAVTHGLFARCIQAMAAGSTIRETPRWGNAEMRTLRLEGAHLAGGNAGESGVSAD